MPFIFKQHKDSKHSHKDGIKCAFSMIKRIKGNCFNLRQEVIEEIIKV